MDRRGRPIPLAVTSATPGCDKEKLDTDPQQKWRRRAQGRLDRKLEALPLFVGRAGITIAHVCVSHRGGRHRQRHARCVRCLRNRACGESDEQGNCEDTGAN